MAAATLGTGDTSTYWGLMRLDAGGKPVSTHEYDNTIWGHNSEMVVVPPQTGGREAGDDAVLMLY
jgi:hypothetical protein